MTCSECDYQFCYICRNDYQMCTCHFSPGDTNCCAYFQYIFPILFIMCLPCGLALTAPLACLAAVIGSATDGCQSDNCCYASPCFMPLGILAFNCGCIINVCTIPLCLFIGPFFFCGFTCGNRIYARYTMMLRTEEKKQKAKKGKSLKGTNPFYDDYDYKAAGKGTKSVASDSDSGYDSQDSF